MSYECDNSKTCPPSFEETSKLIPSDTALSFLLLCTVLIPGHMLSWTVEWAWLALVVAFSAITLAVQPWSGSLVRIDVGVLALIFGLLSGSSAISLARTLVAGYEINERDIAEMLRFPIYGLLACLLAKTRRHSFIRIVDRTLRVSLLYIAFCTVVFFFEIPGAYAFLRDVIYADAKVLFTVGVIRIPFPFENPNFLAYFLMFTLAHFLFFRRNLVYALITLILLFLTGSRSGWLAGAIVLAGLLRTELDMNFRKSERATRAVSLGVILCVAYATLHFWPEIRSFGRLAELLSSFDSGGIQEVDTAQIRIQAAAQLLDWVQRSPFFGWGPGRALQIDVADNQFLSWLLAWGCIGFSIVVALFWLLARHLIGAAKTHRQRTGIFCLGIAIVFILNTGDFLENYRLFFLTLVFFQTIFLISASEASSDCTETSVGKR